MWVSLAQKGSEERGFLKRIFWVWAQHKNRLKLTNAEGCALYYKISVLTELLFVLHLLVVGSTIPHVVLYRLPDWLVELVAQQGITLAQHGGLLPYPGQRLIQPLQHRWNTYEEKSKWSLEKPWKRTYVLIETWLVFRLSYYINGILALS